MTAIAYSQFRRRIEEFVAQAQDEALIITRSDGQDLVLLSKQEYESLVETSHLLSTTANATRLQAAITEIETEIARRAAI